MSIGYACLVLGVANCQLRTCSIKNASEEKLNEITLHNLSVLDRIIDYNIHNKIKLFRISSDIIPFGSHPINQQQWWLQYKELLTSLGAKIKKAGMRVSMHPGQYTVLNSPNEDVVGRAVEDLLYHVRFLDSLGVDSTHKVILHIGGVYGEKAEAVKRFAENYQRLPATIKNRLIIENDEKNYSIDEVLAIGEQNSIPVVFDNLHHTIRPAKEVGIPTIWIERCRSTWKREDGKQKIHYSQQAKGGKPGAHSQTIGISDFMQFYHSVKDLEPDIMLEVKDKNLSALKCIHATTENLPVAVLEKEWAKYKYLILGHSHKSYLQIRELLKDKTAVTADRFYEEIEAALRTVPDTGSEINAAQHVWGYFKNLADPKERFRFEESMVSYKEKGGNILPLKNFLQRLAEKYDISYLLDGYYFL